MVPALVYARRRPPPPSCARQVLEWVAPRGYAACTADRDCVVRLSSCCGPCGFSSANLYRAVSRRRAGAFARVVCPENFNSRLGGVSCAACAGGPPPGLSAACIQNQCRMTLPPSPNCSAAGAVDFRR